MMSLLDKEVSIPLPRTMACSTRILHGTVLLTPVHDELFTDR
jgi:hypothetical protein